MNTKNIFSTFSPFSISAFLVFVDGDLDSSAFSNQSLNTLGELPF
ncbi:hypothetical protein N9M61_02650 [Gammaproteobacteria bacterium]|nr:hypothetical protein [Gammaproteobacteria bacterium]